jgi:succinylglutamate desuccinylase
MSGTGVIERDAAEAPRMEFERILGDVTRGVPGPTVIALGGVHGNERAGVIAARRVGELLQESEAPLRGRFLALAGNIGALRAGRRFLGRDLNRLWSESDAGPPEGEELTPEHRERDELAAVLRGLIRESGGDVVLVDLHSSSAIGGPFLFLSDTLRNRRLAMGVPIPMILGVEEVIGGSLLGWLEARGHACLAIEGGQHDEPSTAEHHEAAIWSVLVAAGALDAVDAPGIGELQRALKAAAARHAGVVEIIHRHPVRPEDGFVMEPGFDNFDPVRAGQLLAIDFSGEVHSPADGMILLPLYQGQGDDGFFVGRAVRRRWLRLSALLRRLRLGEIVHWLPGVSRDPTQHGHIVLDRRVARIFPREILHLLGYRAIGGKRDTLLFERRPETPADAPPELADQPDAEERAA